MKQIQLILFFVLLCLSTLAQNTGNDAASIRAQMAAIRKNTAWNDPVAAKAANAKIQELAAKLTQALRQGKPQTLPPGSEGIKPEEAAKIQQENDDYSNKLWNQMMKSVQQGEGADINLAEPLREEIVEEYKQDESPEIRPEYLQTITVLVLDMSVPTVQRVIEQMENFKAINTLIITGGKYGVPVNLNDILNRAGNYPLKTLNIINFRQFVTELPASVNQFDSLTNLVLFNNQLKVMPELSGIGPHLDSLYLDVNPVPTLYPTIRKMLRLKKLGIEKTSISDAEVNEIERLLPQCQILR